MSTKVVVDDAHLSVHKPSQLHSTHGMTETTLEEAISDGAVRCSSCFDIDGVTYNFPYLRGDDA